MQHYQDNIPWPAAIGLGSNFMQTDRSIAQSHADHRAAAPRKEPAHGWANSHEEHHARGPEDCECQADTSAEAGSL